MKITVSNYRKDKLYPRVVKAARSVLARDGYIAPVELLVEMQILDRTKLTDWRHGRVFCLERVVLGNLSRLSRILRILRFHTHDLGLQPSHTAYMRYGKGPKQRLQFSKNGIPAVEKAYATHMIRPRPSGGKKRKHSKREARTERSPDEDRSDLDRIAEDMDSDFLPDD